MTDPQDISPASGKEYAPEYEPVRKPAFLKRGIRILGIDDVPFDRKVGSSFLVGVLMRVDGYVEMLEKAPVTVDGDDADEAIKSLFIKTRRLARVIMLSGISFAGFNIADICKINSDTGVPVISLFETRGSTEKMIWAIEKHLMDQRRISILRSLKPVRIQNGNFTVNANLSGIGEAEAADIIRRNTIRGKFPEAIRLADIVGRLLG